MLERFRKHEPPTPVDEQIKAVLLEMETVGVTSEEYPVLMAYLERLEEVKAKNRRAPLSRDTMAIVGGNLLIAFMLVAYEQKHVLTSKVKDMFIRPK